MNVVGLIGMQRVGKSEVAKLFADKGYETIKISDILTQIAESRGLLVNYPSWEGRRNRCIRFIVIYY